MWNTIKDAIKSNEGTIRFLVILAALTIAAVVIWHALGPAASGVLAPAIRTITSRLGIHTGTDSGLLSHTTSREEDVRANLND